ncbi:hypothetical protein SIN8267_02000 [Sinobacterium norvegicum]|uniref:Uncharacterized protein n=1 Tax=Sinobacterium norvegicum TaxID=1641715 RepID=A0ABN8EJH9_9GAMM|nr:hypothetical protein [Sinobacterium norvegicum]CAH0991885.1 hypothetical protein SIN8267_02000 [Sinobacterium norvegicum]
MKVKCQACQAEKENGYNDQLPYCSTCWPLVLQTKTSKSSPAASLDKSDTDNPWQGYLENGWSKTLKQLIQ